MDNDTKPWWASKGVWGSIAVIAASVLGMAHVTMNAADQASLADYGFSIATAVAGIIALYGRLAAQKKVQL